MLHVGIDITATIYGRGVSRYTTNLVRGLLKNPDLRLSLYGSSLRQRAELIQIAEQLKKDTGSKAETVIQSYPPSLYNFMWNKVGYPKIKSILPNIDVFHSWDWLQPPDTNLPLVSTIHDVALLKFPETAHPKIKSMHEQSWKILKQRNAHIIAVSRATKNDIIEQLGIADHMIHVVHEALPIEVRKVAEALTEDEEAIIKERLQLHKPFLLFVGTREPRKNLSNIIDAWMPMKEEIELIVAGEVGWDDSEKKYTQIKNLRFLGRVDDQELSVLYMNTKIFLYPSLYEGFGLPILEAFYHGAPVVTSNVSSMPEIAGNAAELVDPNSPEDIRAGIQKILDETEEQQQTRIQRMIIRQHMFSWQKVAKETVDIYKKAVQAGGA